MYRSTARLVAAAILACLPLPLRADPLPDTKPLDAQGDLAAQMVAGIGKHLDRELGEAAEKRKQFWKPDYSSPEAFARSVEPNRERLRTILGVVDKRVPVTDLEYVASVGQSSLVAETNVYRVHAVRWPVFEGVDAEGLLLEPKDKPFVCVVALGDADWTPEMFVGMAPGVPKEAQLARRLAEIGCRVLVPTLIDRKDTWSGSPRLGRMTNEPHREFIYRMAYPLGRHIIGYEVQKVLAAVDWFCRDKDHPPVGVCGYGEGGMLALYSAAVDQRIQGAVVSGYFGPREGLWQEPIYRNVWGLLREFGDAEIAWLIAPGALTVYHVKAPEISGPPAARDGRIDAAAPGRLTSPDFFAATTEIARAAKAPLRNRPRLIWGYPEFKELEKDFLGEKNPTSGQDLPRDLRKDFDPTPREKRQFDQLVAYSQRLLRESEARREEFFWSKLETSSPEKYRASCGPLRDYYWERIIGKLPAPDMPANPRTRQVYDEPKWTGYEVLLDVYPDVFATGVLLVPKDLKPGERRPVVVCQHGLEGRPADVVDPRRQTVYNAFGAHLADRGYVVYAPQNPYIGGNTFRQLQRKANPLGLTLFAFIVRQHERTLDWLAALPFVDAARIGFYGLSYGGETAMRVPPLLDRYALSVCSGDFNRFTWKTVSLDLQASYMLVNTYEIFDFNMGNTFSHAELAALVAPRPFMVERGHDDGVGIDEWVDYEYARVRRLYSRLGLPERTAIEFFAGGHEVHGRATFAFLDEHLGPPR